MLFAAERATVSVTPGTVSRLQGTSAILRCTASRPVTSFLWNYGNSMTGPLPAQATTTFVSSTESELTVTSVDNSNIGTYFCTGVFPPKGERNTDLAVNALLFIVCVRVLYTLPKRLVHLGLLQQCNILDLV